MRDPIRSVATAASPKDEILKIRHRRKSFRRRVMLKSKHGKQLFSLKTPPTPTPSHDGSEEIEESLCVLDGLYWADLMLLWGEIKG